MEQERFGFWTWDELSEDEKIFYAIKENDKDLNKEVFGESKSKKIYFELN